MCKHVFARLFSFCSKMSGSNVRCRSPVDSPVYVRFSSAQKFRVQVAHYSQKPQTRKILSRRYFQASPALLLKDLKARITHGMTGFVRELLYVPQMLMSTKSTRQSFRIFLANFKRTNPTTSVSTGTR